MKAIVTGLNGTLAPVLAACLQQHNFEIIPWDRSQISPDNRQQCLAYLQEQRPDWICHLAMGSEDWAQLLAEYSSKNNCGFLFTSTAMVFDAEPDGPHHPTDFRNSRDDYGKYKVRCEDAIAKVAEHAIIARIGWQIGEKRGGNNMLEALYGMSENGKVRASKEWYPATSFMTDTCDALWHLMQQRTPGTYHIDSNSKCKWNFFEIVCKLRDMHNTNWEVEESDDYKHDQRLVDERVTVACLSERL
ncbi:sugar nucleotide-binding protein [Candidatus Uabimicrobium amorphum]|uniref:dTDP-4-dehydrorhamnose reductase n=1 Tax=Uabimicrobium amorphum TaxID=2596890 RepID=A0A5S9IQU1_UABAM|nr:sugar nucleotide-binding protein [Candidatus Uabimicrobium amorphum]BBM86413.1 NAD(P)-dependent oxidoreductase [Candidatus Uabimicrobium amorphum]